MCILCVFTLLKVVSYYDVSVMQCWCYVHVSDGFPKKVWMGGVVGWGEFYPSFFFLNFSK